ncbi:MAG TPA: fumarylacetoacetate hydrolase family protein [Thermoleophilia bacterium]|nr:fumarylacetoacetate hydrolase family protein [Thermoleophilia bacterium]
MCEQPDYEAELAVVMGRAARNVSGHETLDYVAGYTCANDVTARNMTAKAGQWLWGKTIDSFLPMGPWLVTPDRTRTTRPAATGHSLHAQR